MLKSAYINVNAYMQMSPAYRRIGGTRGWLSCPVVWFRFA